MTINRDAADWSTYTPQRKNVFINGDFSIWQRGIAIKNVGNAGYAADRIQALAIGGGAIDFGASTEHPFISNNGSPNKSATCMFITPNVADASLGTTDHYGFQSSIEGYAFRALYQQTCTLSFWVRSTVAGTYYVSFTNTGAPPSHSYVSAYTVDTASTWEKKSITFIPGVAGQGDFEFGAAEGLRIRWSLGAGTSFQTGTLDQWQAGNFREGTSGVNFMNSVSNTFRITDIQLEVNHEATDFDRRPIQEELLLCQRYFQTNANVNAAQEDGLANISVPPAVVYTTTLMRSDNRFQVPMRANPDITFFAPVSGDGGSPESHAQWSYYISPTWFSATATSAVNVSQKGFVAQLTGTGVTAGNSHLCLGTWTAAAEMV